jgi:hypothetical protein
MRKSGTVVVEKRGGILGGIGGMRMEFVDEKWWNGRGGGEGREETITLAVVGAAQLFFVTNWRAREERALLCCGARVWRCVASWRCRESGVGGGSGGKRWDGGEVFLASFNACLREERDHLGREGD